MEISAIPRIIKVCKASMTIAYCTNCGHCTPQIVVRDPKAPAVHSCGVCEAQKVYSVK